MQVKQERFTRKKPEQLVYLELGAGNGGMLLSASEEGFRFRAVSPLRADGAMAFAFSLDGSTRLEGNGEIEWLDDDNKSGGMRFTEVSPEFRAAINGWLRGASARDISQREVTPAAATPYDTMDKIRQDLRAGYQPRRGENPGETRREGRGEQHAEPRREAPVGPAQPQPEKRAEPRIVPETPAETAAPLSEVLAEKPTEPAIAKAPFSTVTPRPPIRTGSAFLKPAAKNETASPEAAAPTVPSTPASPPVSLPAKPGPERPLIPPLEESFEEAWAKARQPVEPETPHLSRAAAGAVVALALFVIFSALAYNFRKEIGSILIDFGQKISGENRTEPAPDNKVPEPKKNDGPENQKVSNAAQPAENPAAKQSAPPLAIPSETANVPASSQTVPGNGSNIGSTPSESNLGATRPSSNPVANSGPAGGTTSPAANAAKPSEKGTVPARSSTIPVAAEAEEGGSGQEDFLAAREILRGKNRDRDLAKAVDLLWRGVKHGYVPAEVTLADLYMRGDGVAKNCDQARVLLVAASKKGSPDARNRLEQLAEQGCSE